MIFNFTVDFLFSTRLYLDKNLLETISQTKLLGTIISSDVLYIRLIMEQSCQVWHHSITEEEISDLERVQKVASIIILKESYVSYKQALAELNLESLSHRRERLCLNFAKKCLKHEKTRDMFPLKKKAEYDFRDKEVFEVQHATQSAIPQLQRALNKEAAKAK